MSLELLPCPFCGGEPNMMCLGTRAVSCQVACTECGTNHESSDVGERSGSSRNTRAQSAELLALRVRVLEGALARLLDAPERTEWDETTANVMERSDARNEAAEVLGEGRAALSSPSPAAKGVWVEKGEHQVIVERYTLSRYIDLSRVGNCTGFDDEHEKLETELRAAMGKE